MIINNIPMKPIMQIYHNLRTRKYDIQIENYGDNSSVVLSFINLTELINFHSRLGKMIDAIEDDIEKKNSEQLP